MFEIFNKELPMNKLPQCLWANVVADISGPNADPNAMRESNFIKGVTDHVEVAFKPEQGDNKRTWQKNEGRSEINESKGEQGW